MFCPHCIYVFCIYLRTNSDLCHLQQNWLVFITEMKSVYCAVRTGSLNKAVCASSLKPANTPSRLHSTELPPPPTHTHTTGWNQLLKVDVLRLRSIGWFELMWVEAVVTTIILLPVISCDDVFIISVCLFPAGMHIVCSFNCSYFHDHKVM